MAEPLVYQRYWDDQEYRQGLIAELAEVIEQHAGNPQASAEAIVEQVFKRVKIHTWCDLPGCVLGSSPDCRQTHYRFDITTHPKEFTYDADHDR